MIWSGCVMTALKDSSSYYEMSFYPQNVNWDGRFHKIVVKTTRPGVKLTYRRGYYALDAASLAKKQPPEDHLRQACADLLPSTTIPLTVQRSASRPNGEIRRARPAIRALISAAGLGFRARWQFVQPECSSGRLRIRSENHCVSDSTRRTDENSFRRHISELASRWDSVSHRLDARRGHPENSSGGSRCLFGSDWCHRYSRDALRKLRRPALPLRRPRRS